MVVAQGKFSSLEGGVRVRTAIGGGIVPLDMRGTMNHAFFHNYDWFPTLRLRECLRAGVHVREGHVSC
jgi:arylsulfatase A-like enzyme